MFNLPPAPRQGIHLWLPSAARAVRLQGGTLADAASMLYAEEPNLRRRYQAHEVEHAVGLVYGTELQDSEAHWRANSPHRKPATTRWSPALTATIAARVGFSHDKLRESSPDPVDSQAEILRKLFPDPTGLLCVGKSAMDFWTATLAEFGDLSRHALVVPSYMTATHGETKHGKRSMHSLENTGPRRFCVCDFDDPPPGEHASLAWHIAEVFPLVLVVTSGGKSLHSWHSVPRGREETFWPFAIRRGADPALMRNRSSFVRMPGGTRDNGNRQSVLYFDPSKVQP